VDITDNGYGIKKRAGYFAFKTLGISTDGIKGGHFFAAANGNEYLVHANNRRVYASTNDGAYSNMRTTGTLGAYYDFENSLGVLYGADDQRDSVLKWTGTVLSHPSGIPKGKYIEATPDRFVVAGTTDTNRVWFSAKADFTDFSIGGLEETDAFYETFGLPGQDITGIKYAYGKVLAWTKNTLSFWYGTNQFDGIIEGISATVGTKQPYSILVENGVVYWQGQDNHFYETDGEVVRQISRALDVSNIGGIGGLTWLIGEQTDFTAGTIGTGLSATASPGNLGFAPVTIDAFTDGDYTASPAWTTYSVTRATVNVTSSQLRISTGNVASGSSAGIYTTYSVSTGAISLDIKNSNWGPNGSGSATMCLSWYTDTPGTNSGCGDGTNTGYIIKLNQSSTFGQINLRKENGAAASSSLTTVGVAKWSDNVTYNIKISRDSNGQFKVYEDDVLKLSYTDTSYSSMTYVSLFPQWSSSMIGSGAADFDNVEFEYFQARFQSSVFNMGGSVTSWGQFNTQQSLNDGTITYGLYADNDTSINVDSVATFVASQTITSGNIPTITSAQPYLTLTASFARTLSTQAPTLDYTNQRINKSSLQVYTTVATDKNKRILWSVAEGTATVPTTTYIYDPRFDSWLKYSFPMSFAARKNDTLYFGGVSTGVVYSWPSGSSDNGNAITALWQSKDFIDPDPFVEKDTLGLSILTKAESGSNLDINYTVNTTSTTSYNISLTDAAGLSYVRNNRYLTAGQFGTFFNFQFGNNDADAPFEVYLVRFDYKPLGWRVLP
jgi:hypothetical protein